MKTTKRILIALLVAFSGHLFAQDVPTISDKELLRNDEIKKKVGWIKLKLDANFQVSSTDASIMYEYYEFVNMKGQYNSTYAHSIPFPKNVSKVVYKDKSKLLNGTVSFYDKKNHLILQYLFKNGFYLKAYDYSSATGKAQTVIEYLPTKNSVELYANYYNPDGTIKSDSHELNDGQAYKTLAGNKTITPTSLEQ